MISKKTLLNKENKERKIEKQEKKYVKDFSPFKQNTELPEVETFNPEELFGGENGQSETAIIKELFNPKNSKIKTDLSEEEINIISRLFVMSKRYYEPLKINILKQALDELILLRISKDRKSRAEFVEANKEIQKNKQGGIFDKLMGNSNNNL
jgi:predicted nucleotidyltransferase